MKVYGPYTTKDKRQIVILVNKNGKRKTQSYPRYLMEKHLGRKLLKKETVDHIDGNVENNKISNFRLLSLDANIKASMNPKVWTNVHCKYCGKQFKRRVKQLKHNKEKRKVDGPFCSKQCVGKTYN